MSTLKIEPGSLPPGHPFLRLRPEDPMQMHGMFNVRHKGRGFSVLLTRDDVGYTTGIPDWRWHMSIAGRDMKVPAWETVSAVPHELRPGVPFVVGVPPKSWWINVHPGALHLWEFKDANLLAQWRAERRGDTPT
jgi:hypothetical protein